MNKLLRFGEISFAYFKNISREKRREVETKLHVWFCHSELLTSGKVTECLRVSGSSSRQRQDLPDFLRGLNERPQVVVLPLPRV